MDEAILQAVKRAMPGRGRARIHEKLLTILGIDDQTEVEVSTEAGQNLVLTVFADDLVEDGTIRISIDDLKKLEIPEGGKVTVRRKIPLDEQVRVAVGSAADQIRTGAEDIGAKVVDHTKPYTDKVGQAVKNSSDAIKINLPGVLPKEIESALSVLPSPDAKKVKSILIKTEGESAAVTVNLAAGRRIDNLTIPPEANLAGLQRDGKLIDILPDIILNKGDIVYFSGTSEAVSYMNKMLGE